MKWSDLCVKARTEKEQHIHYVYFCEVGSVAKLQPAKPQAARPQRHCYG
jgi:hypothetical protein